MEAVKFDIYGRNAFFKNPESNLGTEFSFTHIHKPVVLGIIGCILGLQGKGSLKKEKILPEYYNKLNNIKIAIIPHRPVFNQYIEKIINSTGFANKNSSQIITKKILQNVRWTIYILKDSMKIQLYNKLLMLLKDHESMYPLYLGNNNYKAKVDNVETIDLEANSNKIKEIVINSILPQNIIMENYQYTISDEIEAYDLSLYMPITLNEYNLYNYIWIEYTNCLLDIDNKYKDNIYISSMGENLYFI